ncbi:MAG: aminopeptidase [Deltaproteobacteria bacterium]|jgi:aminopeptidase|nr:aminopeptidase [Deltaproteobacteria bacterium]
MLTERQLDRYADVLLWGLKTARKARYQKDDIVLIRYNIPAIRLAEILQAKILKVGMNPIFRLLTTPTMEHNFYSLSTSKQLVFLAPGERTLAQKLNGSITLYAPESLIHLRDIDPLKIGKATIAQKKLRDILNKSEAQGAYSWTLCVFPTTALAKHAGLSFEEYSHQIVKACFLNKTSPVSQWQQIFKNAQSIKQWLNNMKVRHYHVESDNIDLKITPGDHRKWVGISGRNIPSFELFFSPDWRGTQGIFFADQPSFRSGNYVRGVRIEFLNGQAIKIGAQEGEDFVRKQLAMDQGANKLGEFSLTDKRFSRIDRFMANTLFDENYGGRFGNCHIAMGSSYSNTYAGDSKKLNQALKQKLGFNESALHWDLVNTEKKRVTAHLKSGKNLIIYENGRFTY